MTLAAECGWLIRVTPAFAPIRQHDATQHSVRTRRIVPIASNAAITIVAADGNENFRPLSGWCQSSKQVHRSRTDVPRRSHDIFVMFQQASDIIMRLYIAVLGRTNDRCYACSSRRDIAHG